MRLGKALATGVAEEQRQRTGAEHDRTEPEPAARTGKPEREAPLEAPAPVAG